MKWCEEGWAHGVKGWALGVKGLGVKGLIKSGVVEEGGICMGLLGSFQFSVLLPIFYDCYEKNDNLINNKIFSITVNCEIW